jgi:hypothetical protein
VGEKTGKTGLSVPFGTGIFGDITLTHPAICESGDQKMLDGGNRESVGAGFTDSG